MIKYWPQITFGVMLAFAGLAWSVDMRIDQRTDAKIQQLRVDVVNDFRQERIQYLEMRKNASIITQDERVELNYLRAK